MVKKLKEKLIARFTHHKAEKKIKNLLVKLFSPDEKFLKETRFLFLELADKNSGVKSAAITIEAYRKAARYVFASIIALIFLGSGLVAYADKQDVTVKSPLYGLKRFGESVKLSLAPAAKEKIKLNVEFAQRRAKEIQQLKKEDGKGSEQGIKNLENDFKANIASIENDNEDNGAGVSDKKIQELCRISSTVFKLGENGQGGDVIEKFQEKCGTGINGTQNSSTDSATSTDNSGINDKQNDMQKNAQNNGRDNQEENNNGRLKFEVD